jgi:hypothetical protein
MPKLYNKQTGALLGTISEADVQALIDNLEEEHRADDDYYIDSATIDLIERAGGSAALVALLRNAVAEAGGIDVRYES